MNTIIDLVQNKKREISPEKFLNLDKNEKRNIESCRFVPPTVGERGFGKFIVTMKHATYSIGHADR